MTEHTTAVAASGDALMRAAAGEAPAPTMEEIEPCPFCDGECEGRTGPITGRGWVECVGRLDCAYRSAFADSQSDAIAAHNRVARAVRRVEELERDAERGDNCRAALARELGEVRVWLEAADKACRMKDARIADLERQLSALQDAADARGGAPRVTAATLQNLIDGQGAQL